jgi:hypothetical protein
MRRTSSEIPSDVRLRSPYSTVWWSSAFSIDIENAAGCVPHASRPASSHVLTRNIRIEDDLLDRLLNSSEKRLARTLLLLAEYGEPETPRRTLPKVSQETQLSPERRAARLTAPGTSHPAGTSSISLHISRRSSVVMAIADRDRRIPLPRAAARPAQ